MISSQILNIDNLVQHKDNIINLLNQIPDYSGALLD